MSRSCQSVTPVTTRNATGRTSPWVPTTGAACRRSAFRRWPPENSSGTLANIDSQPPIICIMTNWTGVIRVPDSGQRGVGGDSCIHGSGMEERRVGLGRHNNSAGPTSGDRRHQPGTTGRHRCEHPRRYSRAGDTGDRARFHHRRRRSGDFLQHRARLHPRQPDVRSYVGGSSESPWLVTGSDGVTRVTGFIGGLNQGGCTSQPSYSPIFGTTVSNLLTRAEETGNKGGTTPPQGPRRAAQAAPSTDNHEGATAALCVRGHTR